jgi:hypothetical protein
MLGSTCMSALTGYILQWDHSLKVPNYMMKLNGIAVFVGLFTVLNELGQIYYHLSLKIPDSYLLGIGRTNQVSERAWTPSTHS